MPIAGTHSEINPQREAFSSEHDCKTLQKYCVSTKSPMFSRLQAENLARLTSW